MSPYAAFERLLPEVDPLLRVARTLTRRDADAEQLVEDTLVRASQSLDLFDRRHPRAWIFGVLRTAHAGRQHVRAMPDTDLRAPTDVAACLARLNEPFRLVVTLVDIGGLSYGDAARVLDVSTGTVASRLRRARSRIRQDLEIIERARARAGEA